MVDRKKFEKFLQQMKKNELDQRNKCSTKFWINCAEVEPMKRSSRLAKQCQALARYGVSMVNSAATTRQRFWRRLCLQGEEGNAIVEMAVVIPILMVILTGTASISLGLYSLQELGNATSSAAILLGAEEGLTTDPCATAVTAVTGGLPGWTPSKLSYAVSITDSTGTAHRYPSTGMTTGSGFSCTAGAAQMAANEPVSLTVSYTYNWMPVLNFNRVYSALNFNPSGSLSSTQTALMQ